MLTLKGTQTIETPRLILRRAIREDAELMFRNWASDPEVTKYLTWPPHENIGMTQNLLEYWLEAYQKDDYYTWMIELKELGEPIGSISGMNCDDRIGKIEIGYCIGKKWWHQGIMTEALKAVIDYFFAEVGMNRIEAKHDVKNPNSGAVMKKCGMLLEGINRMAGHNNQGICDLCVYARLAEDQEKG